MNPSDKLKPSVLSFVNYEPGQDNQNAEARRTVKSHVSRRWHQEKRVAETMKYAGSHEVSRAAGMKNSGRVQSEHLQENSEAQLPPPSVALSYLNGLIPYSYFTGNGPLLYLKPSKWPFPRPFSMAGASRTERFGQSVFPRQSIWMPDAEVPDRVAMKGPLLGGDVLSWISHTPECFKYRVETIAWIQRQLMSSVASSSDETIGAIMTLTMWENGDGSFLDLSKHMDGLESIVKMKGGIFELQQQQMSAKLMMFDYIIAISCAKQPKFSTFYQPQHYMPPSYPLEDETSAGSPLSGLGSFSQIECGWRSEDIKHILKSMWELTGQALEILPFQQDLPMSQNSYRTLLSTLDRKSSIATPKSHSVAQISEEMHIFETLHHTAMVFERAAAPPYTSFDSSINYADLASLYQSLNTSAPNPFWTRYPGILLWVLLVGCAISVKREERSYFMMFLAKVGIFAERRSWADTQEAISRFIDVQSLSSKSSMDYWNSGERRN